MPMCIFDCSFEISSIKSKPYHSPAARVYEAINGHWYSACLGVLLELNIADILEKETQPISVEDVSHDFQLSILV